MYIAHQYYCLNITKWSKPVWMKEHIDMQILHKWHNWRKVFCIVLYILEN